MPLLRFDAVHKQYPGGKAALQDVSFRVEAGEVLFVTGHSGAGKSTLLKLLHLAERPDRGAVLLEDRNLAAVRGRDVARYRRRVGVVFQDHRLLPHWSIADNVALPLRIAGVAEAEIAARVREVLGRVGLGDRPAALPPQLSTGEQQRVGIARAIVSQPVLLVADEPTGNLDSETSREVMELFTTLNRDEGITIVLVTHEPDVAGWAHRLIRLVDGQVVYDGPPAGAAH
ncbi:MAG TPA: cell division ATP-binding protein FtsE [Xanthomonadaceae bacterium]|nr:cell division ATP-binding protein FtsE [Xanthomonadaceae bacterium]